MSSSITKKQFLKRRTEMIAHEIHDSLVEEPEPDRKKVLASYPKVTYYKNPRTGSMHLGLSLRGIRKLVKRFPLITTDQVKEVFGVSTPR